jgi:hypothetical protein
MQTFLWVLGIHLTEIIVVGFYILIKKINKLQAVVNQQQQYIDAVTIAINNADEQLKGIDQAGIFQADDEVGWFFKNLKEIQSILNTFKVG